MTIDQFGKALVASGLMTSEDVKAFWNGLPADGRPKTDADFGKLLVGRALLTPFQVAELIAGRGDRLIMGDYTIVTQIGAGGMGQVYKAQHRRMKRTVALKVMSNAAMQDEAAVKRFQREVHAAARLEHPNIVTAYDSGEAGKVKYLVMQFVDGGDLSELVKKSGRLEVAQAVGYVIQAAKGLAFAHGEGVIHRDIKPANLLLDKKGVVKILDMGLARFEDGGDGLTATEQVMGTVDYMSPEQAANTKGCDGRADIYSLGCTLWYLLTAKKLYEADTLIARLMKHRDGELPSLVKERDDAPWPLEQALHKMIAKRMEERFQSMDEVVVALAPFAGDASLGGSSGGSSPSVSHNADLASFMQSMGTGGAKSNIAATQAKPATSTGIDATAQFSAPEVGTDPKSQVLPKGMPNGQPAAATAAANKPQTAKKKGKPGDNRTKLIAAGALGAVLLLAGIIIKVRDKEGNVVAEVNAPTGTSVEVNTQPRPAVKPATPTTPTLTVAQLLDSPDYIWTAPENLGPTINGPGDQNLRSLTNDQLRLYFHRKGGADGKAVEVCEVVRPSLTVPFGEPRVIADFGTEAFVSGDGLTLLRAGPDIGMALRPSLDAPFGDLQPLREVNTTAPERYPTLSPDGSTLVFGCVRDPAAKSDLWISRRKSPADPFGPPMNAGAPINTPNNEQKGLFLDDGRTLLFFRTDGEGWQMAYLGPAGVTTAVPLRDNPFGTNVSYNLWITPDGRTAYFSADRPGGLGGQDIYVTHRVPKNGTAVPATPLAPVGTVAPPPAVFPFDSVQALKHQEAWAAYLGVPVEFTNGLGMKFRLIPPGEFEMGLDRSREADLIRLTGAQLERPVLNAMPRHRVRISRPFYMQVDEVKLGWFQKCGGKVVPESSAKNPEDVLTNYINWSSAIEFCNSLSKLEGKRPAYVVAGRNVTIVADADGYRLPTEAQWEYSCRAGTDTLWYFGDDAQGSEGNSSLLIAAQGLPNPFGLTWMYAGSSEFCWDSDVTAGYSPEFVAIIDDPVEPKWNDRKVVRGGANSASSGRNRSTINSYARGGANDSFDDPLKAKWNGLGRVVLPISTARAAISVASPVSASPAANSANDPAAVAAWLLENKKLGRIRIEIDGRIQFAPPVPTGPFKVLELNFSRSNNSGQPLTEAEVARLAVFTDLEGLEIATLTDSGLAKLAPLKKLKSLIVPHSELTPAAVATIRQFPLLEHLHAFGNDEWLQPLAGMPSLRSMTFWMVSVSPQAMSLFPQYPNLKELLFHECVEDEKVAKSFVSIAPLKDCKNLSKLTLAGSAVDGGELAVLSGFTQLLELHLTTASLTEAEVKQLAAALPRCKITWRDAAYRLHVFEPTAPPAASQTAAPAATSGKLFMHDPAFGQWLKDTAAKPAEAQLAAVSQKLMELNPGFEGTLGSSLSRGVITGVPNVENGAVTELIFFTDHVADISPLKVLSGLRSLVCTGSNFKGVLADLSPLEGMQLTKLHLSGNGKLSDLSPLKGQPLTDLDLWSTNVSDLTPLKDMRLTKLNLRGIRPLKDLQPLKGMPLTDLDCVDVRQLSNLSPLEGMKLTSLKIAKTDVSDLSPLRRMSLDFLEADHTPITDLLPLKGMALTKIELSSCPNVSDLSPLQDCRSLENLNVKNTKITPAGVAALQKTLPNCKIVWDDPTNVTPAAGAK